MITNKLRRCPFCGNEAEIVPCDPPEWFAGAKHVKIRCSNEYCMMHDHGMIRLTAAVEEYCCTLQSACAEWNTRKMWDSKRQRIQEIYDDGDTYDDLEALREITKIVMEEDDADADAQTDTI